MTTYPDNVPTGYAGDDTDFLKVKRDPSGALRLQYKVITVGDASTAGTTFGLVPFQKGFRLSYGGTKLYVDDLDTATNVTINYGYLYETDTTSDADAFGSAITTGQAAGFVTFDEEEGMSWVATDNGWIVAALAAGPTSTEGTIEAQIVGCYDGDAASN